MLAKFDWSCNSKIRDFSDSYSLVLCVYARVNFTDSLKTRLDEVCLSLLFVSISFFSVPFVFHNKRDGNVIAPVLDPEGR